MVLTSDYLREQFTRHWPFLEKLAISRFIDENLAHEAMLYVAEKIEEDDYKKLKSFSGKSSIKTFLAVVVKRLFNDFARQRFGRVRPPEWLKKKGGLWLEIFRKLCLERNSPSEVTESFRIVNPACPDPKFIEEAVGIILSKITDCGKNTLNTVITDSLTTDESSIHHPEMHHLTPEEYCHACEREDFITILSRAVSGKERLPIDEKLNRQASAFHKALKLSAEESLFLKTVYQEGLSVSAAGRILGWNTNQSAGKHRRIMEKLKSAMTSSGLMDKVNDFFSE